MPQGCQASCPHVHRDFVQSDRYLEGRAVHLECYMHLCKPARLRISPDGLGDAILRNTSLSPAKIGGRDSCLLYIGAEAQLVVSNL